MVTVNGEECHNEWEITFEEIHRNGAIAFAIYNYIRHTDDTDYLQQAGLEVLLAISRFWSQRFQFSEHKQQYVMLGVTGPNEYENNVNNNWYTSYIACWTLRYTLEVLDWVKENHENNWDRVQNKTDFDRLETGRWQEILDTVYLPEDDRRNVFLQQDGFLDKRLRPADSIDQEERPINQHWSWDRILRSCFIKQGDIIQGLYFFEHEFSEDTIRRNYDFYEPMTVQESSLSPCIHSILASKLGYSDMAYQLYLRTARLDLDDYNKEVDEGLHITSMAGTWMTIVEGFAGKRIIDGDLHLSPSLPEQWNAYSFKIWHRKNILDIRVEDEKVRIACEQGKGLMVYIFGQPYQLHSSESLVVSKNILSHPK
jgi:maltose phosphorylase